MKIYTEEELVIIFKDILDVDISKKEMLKYKADLVQRIYTIFLRDFGASVERLNVMPLDAPPLMQQYPDMFRDTGFLLRLGKSVKDYLSLIFKCDEFEPIDIFKPDPVRTKRFFSMFIEFYRHIRENVNVYEEIEKEVELKKDYSEKLSEDIKSYEKEIKKREMENAEREVSLDKVRKRIGVVKENVEARQEVKTRLKGRLEGLKQEIQDLVTNIKEKELLILEAAEKLETLKTQVMQEAQYEEIKEKEVRLSSLKASHTELKETVKELKHNLQLLQKLENLLKDIFPPAVDEYEVILGKKREMVALKEEKELDIAKLHEKTEELSRSELMLKDQLTFLEEKSSQVHKSRELKKRGMEEDIKQLRLTYDEQQRKTEEQEIIEKDLKSEYQETVKERDTLKQNLTLFLKDFHHYMNELKVKVENAAQEDEEEIYQALKHLKDIDSN